MRRLVSAETWCWATAVAMVAAAAMGPWLGDGAAFRYSNVGLAVTAFVGWLLARERMARPISRAGQLALFGAALCWFEAVALTRFLSFGINGVDFSIFDWMLASTARGQLGWTPIYAVNHLGNHSTFLMLLGVPFHALAPSPYWLLLGGPLLLWAGLFPLRRLVVWSTGGHGLILVAAAVAYLASAWVGRLVNSGFRIENLIPVLSLWFLVGWVEERRAIWITAAAALLLTKEDTTLFLAGFALVAAVVERPRWRSAAALAAVSLLWLGAYVGLVQPALAGDRPLYGAFWSDFGPTPGRALVGMLTHPLAALGRVLTSSLWAFFLPLLFLPWRSPRAAGAMAPTVLLLGAATYVQMHSYLTYYPLPLVAFALFGVLEVLRMGRGAADGGPSTPDRSVQPERGGARREGLGLLALLLFPLFMGGYAKTVAIDWPRLAVLPQARAAIASAPRVCAQTVLFPHLGYPRNLEPLFDASCADVPGTVTLVNPELDLWPWEAPALEAQLAAWRATRTVTSLGGGFLVIGPP